MNIFVLDEDPRTAAHYHMDIHLRRQIMTCAEVLCSAHLFLDGKMVAINRIPGMLKYEHIRQSDLERSVARQEWAVWTRTTSGNYDWVSQHMFWLMYELNARFESIDSHEVLGAALERRPLCIEQGARTLWPRAGQRAHSSTVEVYRRYYFNQKHALARWSPPAVQPEWWTNMAFARGELHA